MCSYLGVPTRLNLKVIIQSKLNHIELRFGLYAFLVCADDRNNRQLLRPNTKVQKFFSGPKMSPQRNSG